MSNDALHIVFAGDFDASVVEKARKLARVTVLESCEEPVLSDAVRDADALLVRTRARVTRTVIENAPRLRVIGRAGVGLDNIDIATARQRGVLVVHTPAAATEAVADLTVGMMISLLRSIHQNDGLVRSDRFTEARQGSVGLELSELTIGIVGLGRIGKAVAKRCRNGFGMNVLYRDIIDPGPVDIEVTSAPLQRLFAESDIVSLHVPLTDETRTMIDASVMSLFKPGAMLINTARGAVVDGVALSRALIDGVLGGAALDVFDPEPLPSDHPLLAAPNTLFTAHIGARTHASLARMNEVVDDVIGVLAGNPPRQPAWV